MSSTSPPKKLIDALSFGVTSLSWVALAILMLAAVLLHGCKDAKSTRRIMINDPAPVFSTRDLDGKTVDLAAFKGSPVVLRFWAVDCKYCRADTPIFNRYFDKYRDRGLKVVYINSTADEKTVREFVADLEIGFPVVLDVTGAISASYNVKITPQTIIISPDQKIMAAILGGVSEPELQGLLGAYLM
jgi:peroxiredoxin